MGTAAVHSDDERGIRGSWSMMERCRPAADVSGVYESDLYGGARGKEGRGGKGERLINLASPR